METLYRLDLGEGVLSARCMSYASRWRWLVTRLAQLEGALLQHV